MANDVMTVKSSFLLRARCGEKLNDPDALKSLHSRLRGTDSEAVNQFGPIKMKVGLSSVSARLGGAADA
jgi:uncharacterized membrane-anchored protein